MIGITVLPRSGSWMTSRHRFHWYVDSVHGSDSNNGKTASSALQTIAALLAKTITAGQRIGLARGSSWREQLSVPANNISVSAYGSGERPLLDCSDVILAASFSKTAGRTNVYEASVTFDTTTDGGARYMGVWVNDTRLVQVADVATCDTTPGSYTVASVATSPQTLYIHSTGSTDATSDGKAYEYTARRHGVDCWGETGVRLTGIWARRNLDSYGGIALGQNGFASNCRCSEGNTHNMLLRAGARAENCLADYCYASVGGEVPFIAFENAPTGSPSAAYVGCSVVVASGTIATGFYSHTGGGSDWGEITYDGCTVTGNDVVGFNAANGSSLVIRNSSVTGSTFCKSGVNTTILSGNHTHVLSGKMALITDAASKTWVVTGFNLTIPAGISAGAVFRPSHTGITATVSGVVVGPTGNGKSYAILCTVAGLTLTSNNNSFRANAGGVYYQLTGSGLAYTSDFNNFQSAGSFTIGATPYATIALYKAGTGQDANSTP